MKIVAGALAAMVAHAREEAPDECCGLLLAHEDTVHEAVRARNATRSPSTYLVHPEDHFAVLRRARQEGTHIVGAYHSHPRSPAHPSPTDVAEAQDPALVHVIVSLAGGRAEVRAWRIAGGEALPVEIERVDGGP